MVGIQRRLDTPGNTEFRMQASSEETWMRARSAGVEDRT
jgi:hypothetical protein